MDKEELKKTWYAKTVKDIIPQNVAVWRARYDRKDQLRLENETLVIRQMRPIDMIPPTTKDASFFIIGAAEAYRPDIIANDYYKDPNLYWVILAANGLKDPLDFREGLEIIIPTLTSLYSQGGILKR